MAITFTITSPDGDVVEQISVDPLQTVDSIAPMLQEKFGIAVATQILLHDGIPVRLDLSFQAAGIKHGDLIVMIANTTLRATSWATVTASQAGSRHTPPAGHPGMTIRDIPPNASPELLLDIASQNPHLVPDITEANPKLGQALLTKNVSDVRMVLMEMHMAEAARKFQEAEEVAALEQNPFDATAQAKIEERIRLSNVQKNMEIAIEEMPEAFARVYMLYIPCEVNGVAVKSFVDSGAQSTIMSSGCAERCGIMRLVDKRFAGEAVGVGTAKIIGRVHMAPLKIGNYFYNCSFTILDQQGVDFLFGLDMLKRHQCCIDLHRNVLRLQDETGCTHEVPFLPEHPKEIPASERSHASVAPTTPAPAASPRAAPSETTGQKVQRLVDLGFDAERAVQALATTNGNVQLAAGLLFESI